MKVIVLKSNKWAGKLTTTEVNNWIESQREIGRTHPTGYWTQSELVCCLFGKPLAIIKKFLK